jgi:hypothetical protein
MIGCKQGASPTTACLRRGTGRITREVSSGCIATTGLSPTPVSFRPFPKSFEITSSSIRVAGLKSADFVRFPIVGSALSPLSASVYHFRIVPGSRTNRNALRRLSGPDIVALHSLGIFGIPQCGHKTDTGRLQFRKTCGVEVFPKSGTSISQDLEIELARNPSCDSPCDAQIR